MDIVSFLYQSCTGIHSGKGRTFCLHCTIVTRTCSDRLPISAWEGAQ